ncbi:hypothetical protein [Dictyobacter arantiisoli]|uniref:hypothetical protein n=1 Tax=Dictyobacter arantiisoli TaxID=2014874 RepID=UPI00155B0A22|nr:hypothetical protein [Dictyobacter arantiisoli]
MSTLQNNPLLMALASAVLNPNLRTLLIYDAPYDGLRQIASYLDAIIRSLEHERKIVTTQLGSTEHDDTLWGYIPLPARGKDAQQQIEFKPLLFSQQQSAAHQQLLLIPNLAQISLAVARAGIMLMGTNVAHLERNEQSERWQPQQYWIAACAQDAIGSVSSHLVDRFVLRLRWNDASFATDHQTHIQYLQQRLAHNPSATDLSPADLAQIQAVVKLIKEAQQHHPQATPEMMESLLDYFAEEIPAARLFHRHEITLARYAVTVAQIAGADSVDEQHIADAARLMGISKPELEDDDTSEPAIKQESSTPAKKPEATGENKSNSAIQEPGATQATREKKEQVSAEVQETIITPLLQSVLAPENPYLEESAPILHEEDALRLPWRHSPLGRADHGEIVGIEQGASVHDIAIISTLLHAALFSKQRQSKDEATENTTGIRIRITPEDLHHYRRAPAPEQMLLLLLDYTSLKRCNWQEALLPYLSWAYTRRASISIVKVGAQDAHDELQAEVVNTRNVLAPLLDRTLEASTGRATPLAHGMQLALQTVQRNLQHGRNTVQHVQLIVISDGRGNIPLQASINKRVSTPVTREGIADALKIAQEIRALKHIESVLLNPQPTHYAHLPIALADALGATIMPIPPYTVEIEVS